MMRVTFYETTVRGSEVTGRIEYEAGTLASYDADGELEFLLRGVDRDDPAAVEAALRDAPRRFDGAYVRAGVEG